MQNPRIAAAGGWLGKSLDTLDLTPAAQGVDAATAPTPPEPEPEVPPSAEALARVHKLVGSYAKKSGTFTHPDPLVTQSVQQGLAKHIDELKRPLCPCRFYPDKAQEAQHRTWMCPCDDMQVYKYCHCLLFTREDGRPITEYLPADHEGRRIHGVTSDPSPELGRTLRHRAKQREEERTTRRS